VVDHLEDDRNRSTGSVQAAEEETNADNRRLEKKEDEGKRTIERDDI